METLRIFLSFPNDVKEEIKELEGGISKLNDEIETDYNLRVQTYSYFEVAGGLNPDGAQAVIDEVILPEDCDIVVGVFWKRLGTPVNRNRSGSEYEIRRAYNRSIQIPGISKPRVMLYFSERPINPSETDPEQFKALISFKNEFEKLGLIHSFNSVAEFRSKSVTHIKQYIQLQYSDKKSDTVELSSIPSFSGAISRKAAFPELIQKIRCGPILLVEGISGSGKTYLMSSFLKENPSFFNKDFTFWYLANENDSLERLFVSLDKSVKISGESLIARFRSLFSRLKAREGVLVIDDFENVDHDIGATMLNAARGLDCSALLILLSAKDDTAYRQFDPTVLKTTGYNRPELLELLRDRGVSFTQNQLDIFYEQTNGVPVITKLFVNCVVEGGFDPNDLLQGEVYHDRMEFKSWFEKVISKLEVDEKRLLIYLSVCDNSFDWEVIKQVAQYMRLENYQKAFEGLQRSFLIENYKKSVWSVHQFIRKKAVQELQQNERDRILSAIAEEYKSRVSKSKNTNLNYDEILYLIQAGRYFRKADMNPQTRKIVDQLRKTLKRRGDYGTLYELTYPTNSFDYNRDSWLDYHYVHSCLILGKFKEARKKIIEHYHGSINGNNNSIDKNAQDKFLISKIYAEIENIYHNHETAYDILIEIERDPNWKKTKKNIRDIILLYKVNTLIRLGRLDMSEPIRKKLYNNNSNDQLNYTVAVASSLGALTLLEQKHHSTARKSAREALAIFGTKKDTRGEAWALEILARCAFYANDIPGFSKLTQSALEKRSAVGDCSLEYYDFIQHLERVIPGTGIANFKSYENLLHSEIRRIRHVYGEIKSESKGIP